MYPPPCTGLVGDAERPELRRHIDDLDHAWENITAMYARREQNLADALEKAMEFHETLQVRRRSGMPKSGWPKTFFTGKSRELCIFAF